MARGSDGEAVSDYLNATVHHFNPGRTQVKEAFRLMAKTRGGDDALALQLLALRRYLRIGKAALVVRWSWSDAEIAAQRAREPCKTLYAEAAKVQAAFSAQNPGLSLALSPVRSLEKQVWLWVRNRTTVVPASARLLSEISAALHSASDFPVPPTARSIQRFEGRLRRAAVFPEPSSAAPGTSSHGRGTAVDFVVLRGKDVIAGTQTALIKKNWIATGYAEKLVEARRGTRLVGPLKHPYEPWHWSLGPAGGSAD